MTSANDKTSKVPKTILTQDLCLRPIQPSDLTEYFKLYSDADVMRGWGTFPHQKESETLQLIENLLTQIEQGELIRWAICERSHPDKLIGDVGFWRFVKVRRRGELGAKLAKEFWKKGWMTQALSSVIEYGFSELGLHSVEGNIDPKNKGSIRLVEKIGFERIGLIPEHSFDVFENQFLNTILYSLTKTAWKGFSCQILP